MKVFVALILCFASICASKHVEPPAPLEDDSTPLAAAVNGVTISILDEGDCPDCGPVLSPTSDAHGIARSDYGIPEPQRQKFLQMLAEEENGHLFDFCSILDLLETIHGALPPLPGLGPVFNNHSLLYDLPHEDIEKVKQIIGEESHCNPKGITKCEYHKCVIKKELTVLAAIDQIHSSDFSGGPY